MRPTISVQLYTLRDHFNQDAPGTLEKLAALGFEGVEPAGYGSGGFEAFQAKVQELGLKVTGNHVPLDRLQNDLEAVIQENKALDNAFVCMPYITNEWRGSAENWKKTTQVLDRVGAALRESNITLCYHNHDFEFERVDDNFALDYMLSTIEPEYMQVELDCYWVQKAGQTPVEYLRRYAGRVPLVHVKDMNKEGFFAEVGEGIIDWLPIFTAAEAGGAIAYIVEQDICPGDPLDSVAKSIENLRRMGKL